MLVRFAYLAVTHAFSALRRSRTTDRDKDVEILALRHQLTVLQRQLGDQRPKLAPKTERSSQHFSLRWLARRYAGSDCWSDRTLCCAGIAT
ncbi:hypothetical protein [Kutzneria buriramensis]|uniref:hypothetical protein n=1 Tax=Kutzneria buriramensis TaxID=1045776 RepID=UPI001B867910|nr:hypothetical protein [Kutzneria buriramensis]